MKKLINIILVASMVLAMGVTAFANETVVNEDEENQIMAMCEDLDPEIGGSQPNIPGSSPDDNKPPHTVKPYTLEIIE